jgi:hypothetical protein
MYQFLDRITVTGADDSISPEELVPLAARWPFLEFGILLSPQWMDKGAPRFPSAKWQRELAAVARESAALNLSGHLCGEYVRRAYKGFLDVAPETHLFQFFSRFQLNTHGITHEADVPGMTALIKVANYHNVQFIFQLDDANTATMDAVVAALPDAHIAALHDLSHGAGRAPDSWQRKFSGYCGYAGGLAPSNVADHLEHIEVAHANGRHHVLHEWPAPGVSRETLLDPAWIDAETHLFVDGKFDLCRVTRFVAAAEPWVKR